MNNRLSLDENTIKNNPISMISILREMTEINSNITDKTFQTIKDNTDLIRLCCKTDIRNELLKVMKIKKASPFFYIMHDTGLLKYVLPSLDRCYGHTGGPYHIEDVFDHGMMAGDHCSIKYPLSKLTAYLHDVGKPVVSRINPSTNDIWFEGHDTIGEVVVKNDLTNLMFSAYEVHYVSSLVGLHMRVSTERLSEKSVRRTITKLMDRGLTYTDLMRVAICDKMGGLKSSKFFTFRNVYNQVYSFYKETHPKKIKDKCPINGDDIMKKFNILPGKEVGIILNKINSLYEKDNSLNKDDLFEMVYDSIQK